ncbi:MauE/DoxX family redox-associated membrane protein [Sungkyunkwania multivorans]|uniref:MauE/DoxX family redox-associated membrane protein n=1 Tax=Sungkyunkwania multivorans TaxID=1173618 RepID=A0ABW3CUK8_9FLAO
MTHPWHVYLMASIFIVAGGFHFIRPKAFMRIMPRYLPKHRLLVFLSGFAEVLLGVLLLIQETTTIAAWGIVLLLVSFLPVHWYMIQNKKAGLGLPKWLLYGRLTLQFGLIYWAHSYTQLSY